MLQEEGKEVAVVVAVKDLQPTGTLRRLGRRGGGEPGTEGKPTGVGWGRRQQEPEQPLVPCPSTWNIPGQNLKPNSYAYL